MKKANTSKLVMCALLMALSFVITRFLSIPAFYTKGYINLGDMVVLISAYVLGGPYGAASAAFGASIADASMGFYLYVPATFVIKALMVFVSDFFFRLSLNKKTGAGAYFFICLGSILAETLMVLGYFVYEAVLYKSLVVAFASAGGNLVQGITCALVSCLIIALFKNNPSVSKTVSMMKK